MVIIMGISKRFSAFKLFYDEFIYKKNNSVSYALIERNIEEIRRIVLDIRKTPKFNVDSYMEKLNRLNSRLKEQLEAILKANIGFFDFYLIIYKNHNVLSNEKAKDLPFVISCSFYDDYRLDNKTIEELETSSVVIPKYSSSEKKEIRDESKKYSRFEYFVELIKKANNSFYEKFLDKSFYILKLKPEFNESHFNFKMRITPLLDSFEHIWKRIPEKAKKCADYENISDMMEIAYRKKFTNWEEDINVIINEHFDNLYNSLNIDNELKRKINCCNEISFETYKTYCDEFVQEKQRLLKEYEDNKDNFYIRTEDSYVFEFKSLLIKYFFDKRYKSSIDAESSVLEFAERGFELYSLSEDLISQMFDKVIYDAAHSILLSRGNDSISALITHIYELYNPMYLLTRYEDARLEYERLLDEKGLDFSREVNTLLLDRKKEYGIHGPIPNMKVIKAKLIEKRKDFIFDNFITELYSWDIMGMYDTRNYDLSIIAQDVSIEDMVMLYSRMKFVINDYNFDTLNFINNGLVDTDYDKNKMFEALQEFVVIDIFNKLNTKVNSDNELISKYVDICYTYLKEDILFVDSFVEDTKSNIKEFDKVRKSYLRNSNWNDLLISNNIKGSIK